MPTPFHELIDLASQLIIPSPSDAAYLDPGSGSFILQILLATLLGSLFLVKSFWRKIVVFFQKLFSKSSDDQGQ